VPVFGGEADNDCGGGDGDRECEDVGADIGAGEDVRRCLLVRLSFGWEEPDFEEENGLVLEARRGISRGVPSIISISSSSPSPSSSASFPSTSSFPPLRAMRRRFFFCGLVGVCGWRFSFRRRGEGGCNGGRGRPPGGWERTSTLAELSLKISTSVLLNWRALPLAIAAGRAATLGLAELCAKALLNARARSVDS
jgi:hypothetical protein